MVLKQIKRLAELNEIPLIAKPNAGLPEIIDGKTVYNCPPEEFASFVPELAANGVGIFGGCCGTTEDHIAALYKVTRDIEIKNPILVEDRFPGMLVGATEKKVWMLPEGSVCEYWLDCDASIETKLDDALEAKTEVLGIRIADEASLAIFEKIQGLISLPLCIEADDAAVLDRALRLYQGIAMYRSALDEVTASEIANLYGAIREGDRR